MPNEGWMTTLVHIRNIWAAKETSSQMVLEGPTVMFVRFSAEAIHLSWGPNNVVMSKANGALAKCAQLSPGPAVTRDLPLAALSAGPRHERNDNTARHNNGCVVRNFPLVRS
ncbi:hypothetical protein MTO96_011802 [Rhipicephalus appendiculatus]